MAESEIRSVHEMGALLTGDREGDSGESESPDPGTDPQTETEEPTGVEFFTDLAKDAGLDPERLYKSHFKLDDEQSVSVESVKDMARQWSDVAQANDAMAERESDFAAERVKWLQEAQVALTGQDPAKLDEIIQQTRQLEDQRVKQFIPSWSDTKVESADRELMATYAARFGIPKSVLNDLFDASATALLHDAATRWDRAHKALEKEIKPRKRGGAASTREPPRSKVSGDDVVSAFKDGKLSQRDALGRLLKG